jgi:hypothetical protein
MNGRKFWSDRAGAKGIVPCKELSTSFAALRMATDISVRLSTRPHLTPGLKGHHEVISKPYQGRFPPHAWSHLVLEPFVQHVVQENVRVPLLRSWTPAESVCPCHVGHTNTAPAYQTAKASCDKSNFGAHSRSFSTRTPTLRASCCHSRARLTSGWLASLYREGVEPSGPHREVSDHFVILLSWLS